MGREGAHRRARAAPQHSSTHIVKQLGHILRVLCNDICCKIVERVLGLAVEQQQVAKGFWWEGRALQQEVELLEATGGVHVHVDECAVVEGHLQGAA